MQLATCSLALAGDAGNTILKFAVTPSEVAVLRVLHGDDAVAEIDVYPTTEQRTSRAERERLVQNYGSSVDGRFQAKAVDMLFPGIAARLFDSFDELEMDESFFKVARAKPAPEANPTPAKPAKPLSKKAAAAAEAAAAAAAAKADAEPGEDEAEEEPDDGIGEMNDGAAGENLFQ